MAGAHREPHRAVDGPAYGGGCDIGVSYTPPRIIGAGQAFDLILTARVVDADEALRLDIISRLSDSAVDDALAVAETLCSYGTFGLEAALHVENRSQILASTSGAMLEAASAVLPRRQQ